MNSVLARLLGGGPARSRTISRRLDRNDAALGRLKAARAGFDDSVVSLRKAALDHVDVQDLASTAIRANLDRLARSLGRHWIEGEVCRVPGGLPGGDVARDA